MFLICVVAAVVTELSSWGQHPSLDTLGQKADNLGFLQMSRLIEGTTPAFRALDFPIPAHPRLLLLVLFN